MQRFGGYLSVGFYFVARKVYVGESLDRRTAVLESKTERSRLREGKYLVQGDNAVSVEF